MPLDLTSLPEPQPVLKPGMPPEKAKEQAFYTGALGPIEKAEQTYDTTLDNLMSQGQDAAHSNAMEKFAKEQDIEVKSVVAGIIEDDTLDKGFKADILRSYSNTGFIDPDIKKQYAVTLAASDNSDTLIEQEAQEETVDDLNTELAIANKERVEEDDSNFFENFAGEVVSIVGLATAIVGGTVDFGFKTKEVYDQMKKHGKVLDWDAVSNASGNAEEGFLKSTSQVSIEPLAKFLGLDDEMDDSYTTAALGKAGEGFEWVAEKIAEKQMFGIKTKEEALYAVEAIGFIIPAGLYAKSALKKMGKTKPDSPADVTDKANPKTGAVVAKDTLIEKDGKLADATGTKKETIIAEKVLPDPDSPDYPVRNDIIADINDKLTDATKDFTPRQTQMLETMFDDNLVKKEFRVDDLSRRVNVAKDTNLYYNQATSKINMTSDVLEGKMVFTQGANYAFTSKKNIMHQARQLQDKVKEVKRQDFTQAKDAGLAVKDGKFDVRAISKSIKQNNVVIRDLKTKTTMTLDEFEKTNFKKGKYQIEYNFRKKYDLLSDEMLGESFFNKNIGLGKIGNALNRSSLGEYLFGTGFTAKWFEQARADLAPKANRISNEIVKEFNDLTIKNRKIREEIGATIKEMEIQGVDTLSKSELIKNFPDLDTKQINALDATQQAYRQAQDTLFEITNIGEKQRMMSNGYNKGIYIDGEYKGAVTKALDEDAIKNIIKDNDNFTVYDSTAGKFVKYDPEGGYKIVKTDKNTQLKNKTGDALESSDYVIVGKNMELDLLPERVLNKDPGHTYRNYRSNFFIRVVPKSTTTVIRNGKKLLPAELLELRQTRGTATTRFDAQALADDMSNPKSKNYIGDDYEVLDLDEPNLQNITDFTAEYKSVTDNYLNATARKDILIAKGDPVLVDPKKALNDSARNITRTGTASQFDNAYKAAFVRDFGKVLKDGKFPDSIDDISATRLKGMTSAKANQMVKEAKNLYTRHAHFQRSSAVNAADTLVQRSLHHVADIMEKAVKIPGLEKTAKASSRLTRDIGNYGATGMSSAAKRVASLAYITYQMPLRHFVIQPMMFYEQSIIFPKTFAKTMMKTPAHVVNLLDSNPTLNGMGTKLRDMLPKKQRAEFDKELAIMRKEGILESIDQNLAVSEAVNGGIKVLDPKYNRLGKAGEAIANPAQKLTGGVNRYGFATGELANRVGLWLQNKERWIANPKNKGKRWDDPRNVKEISFEAWKQSGAMTSAGALQFQRLPLFSFFTQFQSINMKGFMNVLQDSATNLTRADRVKLTANRIAMHGLEFGPPLGAGKLIYDYMSNHEDESLRNTAEAVRDGYLDRFFNMILSTVGGEDTNVTLSQGASINATNAYADITGELFNVVRFMAGGDAEAPGIPGVQAIGNIGTKLRAVTSIFKYRPLNLETASDAMRTLAATTSLGNNFDKAMMYYDLGEIISKNGTRKGIPITGAEALIQSMGFKTRAELDQWRQKEMSRSIDERVSGAITRMDEDLYAALRLDRKDTDQYFKILNYQISSMEQSGTFTTSQVERIMNGVINKHQARFKLGETDNLIGWVLKQDPDTEGLQAMISRFKSHPDPNVRDIANILEGKHKQVISEEID